MKKTKEWQQIYSGKDYYYRSNTKFMLGCCDCGLVHEVVMVNHKSWINVAMRRNKRLTANLRKQRKFPCKLK